MDMPTIQNGVVVYSPEVTRAYCTRNARRVFERAGGNQDNAGELAEWAIAHIDGWREHHRIGVVVEEGGAILAHTRLVTGGRGGRFRAEWRVGPSEGRTPTTVNDFLSTIRGRDMSAIHVHLSEVVTGPGRRP